MKKSISIMGTKSFDATPWAFDLCALLDHIEQVTDDPKVLALTQTRFVIAEKHGCKIQNLGPIAGESRARH